MFEEDLFSTLARLQSFSTTALVTFGGLDNSLLQGAVLGVVHKTFSNIVASAH